MVVDDDELAVGGQVYIELDARYAFFFGEAESRHRVLGSLAR
jgi:hypothetical protein